MLVCIVDVDVYKNYLELFFVDFLCLKLILEVVKLEELVNVFVNNVGERWK